MRISLLCVPGSEINIYKAPIVQNIEGFFFEKWVSQFTLLPLCIGVVYILYWSYCSTSLPIICHLKNFRQSDMHDILSPGICISVS